jgi:UDP-glucuronate 4-epimerase
VSGMCPAVLGFDNFNDYYPSSLKRDRQTALQLAGVHVVDADLNDDGVLRELFRLCTFTHVLHLAAQVMPHVACLKEVSSP